MSQVFFVLAALVALPVFGQEESVPSYPWPPTAPIPLTTEWIRVVEAQFPLVERDLGLLEKEALQLRDQELELDLADWSSQVVSVIVGQPQNRALREKAKTLLSKARKFGERVRQHAVRTLDEREIREVPFFIRRDLARLQWRYRDLVTEVFRLQRKCQGI